MKKVTIFLILIFLGFKVPGQVNRYGVPVIRNYITQITPRGRSKTGALLKIYLEMYILEIRIEG